MSLYAKVAVEKGPAQVLDYRVPAELEGAVFVGKAVTVPLGPRKVQGFIVALSRETSVSGVRDVIAVDDEPPPPGALQELAGWMERRYLADPYSCRRTLRPVAVRLREAVRYRLAPGPRPGAAELGRKAPKQAEALKAIAASGLSGTKSELAERAGVSPGVIDALVKKDFLIADTTPSAPAAAGAPVLTPRQRECVEAIASGDPRVYLLHGVTGSGKTEVYLGSIARFIEKGREAIVLVPEISLTPQTVGRFRDRFGSRVAVLHSRLSSGERYKEWERIARGEARVAVGARSALFAPFQNLGIIVVDEEHEPSYKQEQDPRYHARDLAVERGRREGATVVLGSATPSLESYYRAQKGEYTLLRLPERVAGPGLPRATVVDMRQELKAGNNSVLSRRLRQAVETRLFRKEQTILFLNRRGHSTFVNCRDCGEAIRCPNCDVSLTFHFSDGRLRCHYCGFRSRPPKECPSCGSRRIRYFGSGTQKVEEEVRRVFPGARVLRMDADTTRRQGSHGRILEAFAAGEADILIGTQMIAKGLDYPGVTLVGVLAADVIMNLPDFRAAERTFQLITQVSGRAGRGQVPGEVIIQTYYPGHYSLRMAVDGDYEGFYRREISLRQAAGFPPVCHLVRLVVGAGREDAAREAAAALVPALAGRAEFLGPAPAPVSRLKGRWRWHLLVRGGDLESLLEAVCAARGAFPRRAGVSLTVDVDPVNML